MEKERRIKSIREKVEEIRKKKNKVYEPPVVNVYKSGGKDLMGLTP